jgi:hypothetical protein
MTEPNLSPVRTLKRDGHTTLAAAFAPDDFNLWRLDS